MHTARDLGIHHTAIFSFKAGQQEEHYIFVFGPTYKIQCYMATCSTHFIRTAPHSSFTSTALRHHVNPWPLPTAHAKIRPQTPSSCTDWAPKRTRASREQIAWEGICNQHFLSTANSTCQPTPHTYSRLRTCRDRPKSRKNRTCTFLTLSHTQYQPPLHRTHGKG